MTVVRASQKSTPGVATYANSITLTPGTITVGVSGNDLTIHALVRMARSTLKAGAWTAASANSRARPDVRCRRRRDSCRSCPRDHARHQGPTVFDRVLAGNSVGTLAIMLLAVVGFLTGRPEFLDIGLTYGLLN